MRKKQLKLLLIEKNKEIDKLVSELRAARDLKEILNKFSGLTINGNGFSITGGSWNTDLVLPDNVAQYVDDYFGGKVIKQEAIKVIEINKDGEIKTGLTKQKPDKGYSYKLVRK